MLKIIHKKVDVITSLNHTVDCSFFKIHREDVIMFKHLLQMNVCDKTLRQTYWIKENGKCVLMLKRIVKRRVSLLR